MRLRFATLLRFEGPLVVVPEMREPVVVAPQPAHVTVVVTIAAGGPLVGVEQTTN